LATSANQQNNTKKPNSNKNLPGFTVLQLVYFIVSIILLNFFMNQFLFPKTESVKIPYSLFREEVSKGNVKTVHGKGEQISGKFEKAVIYRPFIEAKKVLGDSIAVNEFKTIVPTFADEGLEKLLLDNQVEILTDPSVEQSSPFLEFYLLYVPYFHTYYFLFLDVQKPFRHRRSQRHDGHGTE
jgi:cell division protease FtsH